MSLSNNFLYQKYDAEHAVWAHPRPSECTKTFGGRGFAPDPTGGAYSAPPDPLADAGGGHPLPHLPPSAQAPRSSRLRRSLGAFGASTVHHWARQPPRTKILRTALVTMGLSLTV
jgi:hypothetical protein